MTKANFLAQQTQLSASSVSNTLKLLDSGATVAFIARYRKENTGELNEVEIEKILNASSDYNKLEQRKTYILKSIDEKKALTEELKNRIQSCFDDKLLEDLYLPFKTKKQTKAEIARKNGLEPLAKQIMSGKAFNLNSICQKYFSKEISTAEQAIDGAQYIMAEWFNENVANRDFFRRQFLKKGIISSKLVKSKEEEAEKFKDYFNFSESINRIPSHRVLAILRGKNEGLLRVKINLTDDDPINYIQGKIIANKNAECAPIIIEAFKDALKRLMFPALENEIISELKQKADSNAIDIFAKNVEQLLLEAPLGQKRILAIDPGFRTGCKTVCLNENGDLLHNETIYPFDKSKTKQTANKVHQLVEAYKIDAIAIGNGTAGRETENFIRNLKLPKHLTIASVNESGASVYSASKIAREEFPNYDITVRGAVSIGRRLMDPLAELVKIDPKSIGVGQYQHDVNQTQLKESLTKTVSRCVNKVGVELNTASKELLSYVSGLGPGLAEKIVEHRKQNGDFVSKQQLLEVPRLGEKAFEQCAGFLRIKNGINPLDNSAVHPESYSLVDTIARKNSLALDQLIGNTTQLQQINPEDFVTDKFGLPTIKDILKELEKPNRDPRSEFKKFAFSPGVSKISDLREGMELNGLVSNITSFGCFVDIGVHQDGLVHLSELANQFISDANEIVSLKQRIRVKVIQVDETRKRIGLSMKQCEQIWD